MIRRIILGSVGIVAALVFAMNANAQQVVSSTECNSAKEAMAKMRTKTKIRARFLTSILCHN